MSRRHSDIGPGFDNAEWYGAQWILDQAQERRLSIRRSGAACLGMVGKRWVVLSGDPLNEASFAGRIGRRLVSGIRKALWLLVLD